MKLLHHAPLRTILRDILKKRGVCAESRAFVVESLVQTSLRGVDSHGIALFPHYCRAAQSGRINPAPRFSYERTGASTAIFDADHAFGQHAGAEAMLLAVESAKASGVGAVAVTRSSHFGAAAFYGFMAADQDCLGLSFTNAGSQVLAFNSVKPFFGTNPVCLVAPMLNEGPFCLDMATSAVSVNKLRNHKRNGKPLMPGQAYDEKGCLTENPQAARYVAPLGGYKGFALSMMVELLCGLLTGGPVGAEIIQTHERLECKRNLSQFFTAVDIARFQPPPFFKARLQKLADSVRALPPAKETEPVLVPGDPEKKCFEQRIAEGIPVDDGLYAELAELDPRFKSVLV
ncbi:MAG: Ldh family oxidoreductase [Desulfovibrio sp.]|jgi:ureidoglycolate dehydrogenase (NAD+)|nr:Ldh family oxidoreductase [Desulfovibrio sp.]